MKYQRCVESVSLRVWTDDDKYILRFTDKAESPFASFTVLGTMLDRAEALASARRPTYLHVAEHIVASDQAVNAFLHRQP